MLTPVIAAEPPAGERPAVVGPIRYVGPDTYILLDELGQPQPMLGITYEEFIEAWKKTQGIERAVAEPRYAIEDVRIVGRAKENHAELDVAITIRLMVASRVRIPLGMARGILGSQPRWERLGDAATATDDDADQPLVDFVPSEGGFVARIDGQPGERHRVTLRLFAPLERDGNKIGLPLNLPRALRSQLTLDVPSPITVATVNSDALLSHEAIASAGGDSATASNGTRISVTGPVGDFRLTWATADPRWPELATVLSATGAMTISIDGHSIRCDARLTVRSHGGSFDRFRVRLPPGAQLVQRGPGDTPTAPPGYRITLQEGPAVERQIVLVELSERQTGPIDIELATEQPFSNPPRPSNASEDAAVELAGFEVLGAVRQFGDIALRVADDWQVRWEPGNQVRQVEPNELAPPLAESNPTAAFQYDRQPWSLRTQIVEREYRIHATPSYILDLGPDEARLQIGLAYQVPGARAFEFRVQLKGWQLSPEPILSDSVIDRDRVQVTRDGTLIVPLAQASPRRVEIALVVRRDLPPPGNPVELPLPVPEADSVATGELAVLTTPGIEVQPDARRTRGLAPLPVTSDTPPAIPNTTNAVAAGVAALDTNQRALRYRAWTADAVFAADRTIRPRVVESSVVTRLEVDRSGVVAGQTVDYHVRNQPLDQLVFDVPAGWTLSEDRATLVESEASGTEPSSVPEEIVLHAPPGDPASAAGAVRQIQFPLPQPRLGRFQVRLKFIGERFGEPVGAGPLIVDLPRPALTDPRPGNGAATSHRVTILSAPDLELTFAASDQTAWRSVAPGPGNGPGKQRIDLVANEADAQLALAIRPIDRRERQITWLDRVWLQTWQAGGTVQERAAYRFRTNGSSLVVELPPDVRAEEVEALVDGRLADVAGREAGRLVIVLTDGSATAKERAAAGHTLELRYRRAAPTGWLTRRQLTPPQLAPAPALGEVYWQIVLPGGLHMIGAPDPLVAVDRWQWFDVFWGRQPQLDQSKLEQWVGASPGALTPSPRHSTFLLGGHAPVASITVLTAPRWFIVMVASGVVLIGVLAWIYLPHVRRGWIALVLAAMIGAMAISYPVPALLVGQASIAGWLLAFVALALRRWLALPSRAVPLSTGSTQLRRRSLSRSDSYATAAMGSSTNKSTAEAVALPESK